MNGLHSNMFTPKEVREKEKEPRPPPGPNCLASKAKWHLYFGQNCLLAGHLAEVLFRARFVHAPESPESLPFSRLPPTPSGGSPFSVKSKGTLKRKIYLSRQSYLTSEISVMAVVV